MKQTRKLFDLNQDWRFSEQDYSVFPQDKGHMDIYSFAKAGGCGGPAAASFPDQSWEMVTLPHDWVVGKDFDQNGAPSHGYKQRGVGWYRRRFRLEPEDQDCQILLEFDGISTHAQVYVNGSVLHRNWCGYTSFAVDITDRVFLDRPNTIAVRVDAQWWEGWWYEGAGIYRNVRLVKKPRVHLAHDGVFVKPIRQQGGLWDTVVEVAVENSFEAARDCTVRVSLCDGSGQAVGEAQAAATVQPFECTTVVLHLPVRSPDLWDVETPVLYTACCQVSTETSCDCESVRYGYRSIRFERETGFFLNDRPLKLKGTCNHQDHAGIGVAVPDGVLEHRMWLLKEMGSNAYRCAHGNPDPRILDLCDRMGILVMDENRNFDSSPEGLRQVRSMVRRDRNHPSVILYSIFNEESLQGTLQGARMSRRMMDQVKRIDDTRPVMGAMNGGFLEEAGCAGVFDVTGINYFPETYEALREKFPAQAVCGAENNCALSTRGVYITDRKRQIFSNFDEEKASWGQTIREAWRFCNEHPFATGMFAWTGFDYRGEPSPTEWPSINSHWGILDTCGFPKDGYFLYQALWSGRQVLHIAGDLNAQAGKVMVFSSCEEVEVWVDDVSLGRRENNLYEQTSWQVTPDAGCVRAVGYHGGKPAAEQSLRRYQAAARLQMTTSRAYLYADAQDAILVNVQAVDANGVPCGDAAGEVRFSASGGGVILGVGNGDPNCHEPDRAERRSLFHGKCQMILQAAQGACGSIAVTASADGMEQAQAEVELRMRELPPPLPAVHDRFVENWRMSAQLTEQFPVICGEIDATDMNTFEPVMFGDGPQNIFQGQYEKYGVYRTILDLDGTVSDPALFFYRIMGYVWVYLGKEQVGEADCRFGEKLQIAIPAGFTGRQALTVVIQCNGADTKRAGICRPVILKGESAT